MSSAKRTLFKQLISQSGVTATFSTAVTDTTGADNLSYEIVWSGASAPFTGTFAVQGADAGNILPNGTAQNMTFTPITLSGTPGITSASGSHLIAMNQIPFRFLQLVYTPSGAGAANITVNVYGKEL